MKKGLLLGLLAGLALGIGLTGGRELAAFSDRTVTKIKTDHQAEDYKVNGNDILGADGTTRITFGASAPNVTLAGDVKLAIRRNTAPRTNVTPAQIGELIIDTGNTPPVVCFATGTTNLTWVNLSTPTAACPH